MQLIDKVRMFMNRRGEAIKPAIYKYTSFDEEMAQALLAVDDAEQKADELIFGRFGFLTLDNDEKIIDHSHVVLIRDAFREIRQAMESTKGDSKQC